MYSFEYQRPTTRAAATAAIQGDARFLAGGQSLVQAMRLRLSSSERLVDLGSAVDLCGIRIDGNNVVIGAMTTHAAVAASKEVQQAIPALAAMASGIGDRQVRNRGTIGGALANNDPAACYPAAVLGLGATTATGDPIPAVLFGVPGGAASAATVLDGYPMAKRGEAGRALSAAYMSSLMGGIFGALLLAISIPILRPVMLFIGSPELLAFSILGISMVAVLSGNAPLVLVVPVFCSAKLTVTTSPASTTPLVGRQPSDTSA